jgi:dephospho-CoA kinase
MAGAVIAVLGLAGSGKSVAVGHLEKSLGAETIYFGGVVIAEVERRGMPVTAENEREVREELRAEDGMAVMAKRSIPAIEQSLETHGVALIDGLYSGAELDLLSERYGSRLVTVAIQADRSVREERLATRPVRPLTAAQMLARDIAEISALDKARPIVLATIQITNNGSTEDLEAELERVVAKSREIVGD